MTLQGTAVAPPVRGDMTVNETVQLYPQTLPVFQVAGIDACCGGARRIDDVAARHQIDLAALLAALNRAAGQPEPV